MDRRRENRQNVCLFSLYSKIFCLFCQGEGRSAGEERRKLKLSHRSAVEYPLYHPDTACASRETLRLIWRKSRR